MSKNSPWNRNAVLRNLMEKSKECDAGKVRNPYTGNCIKQDGATFKQVLARLQLERVETFETRQKHAKKLTEQVRNLRASTLQNLLADLEKRPTLATLNEARQELVQFERLAEVTFKNQSDKLKAAEKKFREADEARRATQARLDQTLRESQKCKDDVESLTARLTVAEAEVERVKKEWLLMFARYQKAYADADARAAAADEAMLRGQTAAEATRAAEAVRNSAQRELEDLERLADVSFRDQRDKLAVAEAARASLARHVENKILEISRHRDQIAALRQSLAVAEGESAQAKQMFGALFLKYQAQTRNLEAAEGVAKNLRAQLAGKNQRAVNLGDSLENSRKKYEVVRAQLAAKNQTVRNLEAQLKTRGDVPTNDKNRMRKVFEAQIKYIDRALGQYSALGPPEKMVLVPGKLNASGRKEADSYEMAETEPGGDAWVKTRRALLIALHPDKWKNAGPAAESLLKTMQMIPRLVDEISVKLEAEHAAAVQSLQQELRSARALIDKQSSTSSKARRELDDVKTKYATLYAQYEALLGDYKSLVAQSKNKNSQIGNLSRRLQQQLDTDDFMSQQLELEKQKREQNKETFRKQQNKLMADMTASRNAVRASYRNQLDAAEAKLRALEAERLKKEQNGETLRKQQVKAFKNYQDQARKKETEERAEDILSAWNEAAKKRKINPAVPETPVQETKKPKTTQAPPPLRRSERLAAQKKIKKQQKQKAPLDSSALRKALENLRVREMQA